MYSWDIEGFGSVEKATRHQRFTVGRYCRMGLPEQDTECEADRPGDHYLELALHNGASDLV